MRLAQAVWLLATAGAIIASAAMNYHYMASEGGGVQGQILGAVSVVLDLGKAVLPVLIAGAWATGAWLRAGLGGFFLVLLVLFGFASALGFGETSKGGRVATREGASAMLRSVEAEITSLETRQRSLQSHRSLAEAEAALKAAWLAPIMDGHRVRGTLSTISRQCTIVSALTADLCRRVQAIIGEVATAGEGARIVTRLAELQVEQRQLHAQGAGRDADPQASAIRRLVGRLLPDPDLATIRAWVIGVLAVLIEGMSAFGLYLAGIHQRSCTVNDKTSLLREPDVERCATDDIARLERDVQLQPPEPKTDEFPSYQHFRRLRLQPSRQRAGQSSGWISSRVATSCWLMPSPTIGFAPQPLASRHCRTANSGML